MTLDEAKALVRKRHINHVGDPSGFVSPSIFRAADVLLSELEALEAREEEAAMWRGSE